ncbi:MAG: tetratricopeptide repeat protein [candidate division Zixibacteria bacterium]|nr:tetratricopeptide repeat protein [candidate division Zixibacteria bacterium]
MYNKVKLTKRQIKEDKFTTFMLSSKQQVLENWQYIVMGVIVVVLVVVAVVYYLDSRATRTLESGLNYNRAVQEYRNGQNQVAIASLSQILEKYSGESVEGQATFMLGKVNYELRNYVEAIRYYEMYLAKFKDRPFVRCAALAGVGAAYENQASFLQAADAFARAYEEDPESPLAGDYLAAVVRNYLQLGDIDKAKVHLDLLEKDFGDTDVARRAVRLFSEKTQG